jgi:hypothetical protein
MPLLALLVLEAGSGTKFQLLPLVNIVGPFLGLTRNLGARQSLYINSLHIVKKMFVTLVVNNI